MAGVPCARKMYVINGDMVDRGAWGLETLLIFCCWKILYPSYVLLLRGNHETATCAIMYGFKQEVEAKYGKVAGKVRPYAVYAVRMYFNLWYVKIKRRKK